MIKDFFFARKCTACLASLEHNQRMGQILQSIHTDWIAGWIG